MEYFIDKMPALLLISLSLAGIFRLVIMIKSFIKEHRKGRPVSRMKWAVVSIVLVSSSIGTLVLGIMYLLH